jgi:hypothetical protein
MIGKQQVPNESHDRRGRWLIGSIAVGVALAGVLCYVRIAGSEAIFDDVLEVLLAISVVVGSIFFSLRAFQGNREAYNSAARQHDAALEAIARLLHWKFCAGYGFEYVTSGKFEGWGSVEGTSCDLSMRVYMAEDGLGDGPNRLTTVLVISAPAECDFSVAARSTLSYTRKRGKLVGSHGAPLLVEELDSLATEVEISKACLKVTLAPPAKYFKGMSCEIATQPDVTTLREAISVSSGVARRLLADPKLQ